MNNQTQGEVSWKSFCNRCSLHGVPDYVTATTRASKVSWITLILLATASASYGCYCIIQQYNQMPLYVSYMIKRGPGRETPDIIVCPFNRFSKAFIDRYNFTDDFIEYIQLAYGFSVPYWTQDRHTSGYNPNSTHHIKLEQFLRGQGWNFPEFIEKASVPCQKLIPYCYTPAKKFYDCCETALPMLFGVGRCYRIRGPIQLASGYGYGVTIAIDASSDDYVYSYTNLHNDGVSIRLAEPNKAKGGLNYDLTFLPAGAHALMPLRAVRYEFINWPPQYNCMDTMDDSYFVQGCVDECVFADAENKCNCSHLIASHQRYPVCTPHQLYECLIHETYKKAAQYIQVYKQSIFNICAMKCKHPCKYWEYYPTVTLAQFPSSHMLTQWINRSNLHNFIMLDVFYERLEYTIIRHMHSMTLQQFISNLGGQLGLWVGGSILTLTQLIMFLLEKCASRGGRASSKVSHQGSTAHSGKRRRTSPNSGQEARGTARQVNGSKSKQEQTYRTVIWEKMNSALWFGRETTI